ncbi:MAG: bifunctional methylenetetrahydrofolate dehydrogenase/methenyltetrahydrofolate cyclohydrolase FolD [Bacteroidales bacterium]|nr:bifunctional methylenetetrahydrofolate dehydrogenase/methenyltetrahydrofolate cyclohydrolase FolD [Bacteroidales bacterium]
MAQIIDGKQIATDIKTSLKVEAERLFPLVGRRAFLTVVLVGDDPASRSYTRGKIKACEFVGIDSDLLEFPSSVSEEELLKAIERLNEDDKVDGILVQLPLPAHISKQKVIDAICREKDVDGFHPLNVGRLDQGYDCISPCTPKGIMRLINSTGVETEGKIAVVVGRSNIVGKPVAKLLLQANCTLIQTHSHTRDLDSITRMADILVVAVGKPGLIKGNMVKKGAVVIDVGISRCEDGLLHGDVDFESTAENASFITPVPGGVGPMTIAMLMANTLECYKKRNNIL